MKYKVTIYNLYLRGRTFTIDHSELCPMLNFQNITNYSYLEARYCFIFLENQFKFNGLTNYQIRCLSDCPLTKYRFILSIPDMYLVLL